MEKNKDDQSQLIEELTEDEIKLLSLHSLISQDPKLKTLSEILSHYDTVDKQQRDKLEALVSNSKEESSNRLISIRSKVEKFPNFVASKPIIVYIDGVFDMVHSGHLNGIRQAKKLSDVLWVGINSDEDVLKAKGPTVMCSIERAEIIKACKWVDRVLIDTPYTVSLDYLNQIGADFSAHGDDLSLNEHGEDTYKEIKSVGRMKIFKRTEGISTTDLLGRIIKCIQTRRKENLEDYIKIDTVPIKSKFLATGKRLSDFSNDRVPSPGDKVVYIDGFWDLLHIGHIEVLQKAKEIGDFVYVGIYDDTTVRNFYGENFPFLSMPERICSIMSLKYADDVVIAAPWVITEDLITSLNIDVVIDCNSIHTDDPYRIPREKGILRRVTSEQGTNNEFVIKKIEKDYEYYVKKYNLKVHKEVQYYENKQKFQEV